MSHRLLIAVLSLLGSQPATAATTASLVAGSRAPEAGVRAHLQEGADGASAEARGDAAWRRRAEGAEQGVAQPGPIAEAIDAYEEALERRPDDLGLRNKLLRALLFRGEYVPADKEQRRQTFERGRRLFQEGRDRLAERLDVDLEGLGPEEKAKRLRDVPGAGELYFWGAVHWGLWGEYFGNFAAARRGVAGKIREYGETARLLSPDLAEAGPYRLLGRLHVLAPWIPFVTGWVDRQRGIDYLEQAVERAPEDPLNRFFLADALLEHASDRRDEAIELLCELSDRRPSPEEPVEDAEALERARQRLRTLAAGDVEDFCASRQGS